MPVRRKRLLCMPAIALVALALTAGTAAAQNWLDPSFGEGGRVWLSGYARRSARVPKVHLAEAPDGTILIADEGVVYRLQSDGRMYPPFGAGGVLGVSDPANAPTIVITDLAVDSKGRTIVFATATESGKGVPVPVYSGPSTAYPSAAEVLRYTATGQLDLSFGGGDGLMRTTFGLEPSWGQGQYPTTAGTGVGGLDSQGRPLLVGTDWDSVASCGHSARGEYEKLVARLTPEGDVDNSFGAGSAQVALGPVIPTAEIAVGADDKPLLLGKEPITCGPSHAVLQRLETNGNPDLSFGEGGIVTFGEGTAIAVAVDAQGRILVLESFYASRPGRPRIGGFRVIRLLPDGSRDPSFGRAGVAKIQTKGRAETTMASLTVAPSGEIFLSGTIRVPDKGPGRSLPRHKWFAVMKLGPDGELDRQLGPGGVIRTRFGATSNGIGQDAVVDPEGRLVLAGIFPDGGSFYSKGVVRYDFRR